MKLTLEYPEDATLREARKKFEIAFLLAAIEQNDGNISATAKQIEMDRTALHHKLVKLEIAPPKPVKWWKNV